MKSFPWIKQSDAMQCGSACLAMICMFHGQKKISTRFPRYAGLPYQAYLSTE